MEILQGLLDNLTALLAASAGGGVVYGLCALSVSGSGRADPVPGGPLSAADSPHAGELGPAEPAKRHVPAPDPLGEHPGPGQDGGHLSELSQHLPAARRPLPGRR